MAHIREAPPLSPHDCQDDPASRAWLRPRRFQDDPEVDYEEGTADRRLSAHASEAELKSPDPFSECEMGEDGRQQAALSRRQGEGKQAARQPAGERQAAEGSREQAACSWQHKEDG